MCPNDAGLQAGCGRGHNALMGTTWSRSPIFAATVPVCSRTPARNEPGADLSTLSRSHATDLSCAAMGELVALISTATSAPCGRSRMTSTSWPSWSR